MPHPDPSRRENVAAESALYSLEGATESVDLLCEIAQRVVAARSDAAEALARDIAPRVEQLLAERKRLADDEKRVESSGGD